MTHCQNATRRNQEQIAWDPKHCKVGKMRFSDVLLNFRLSSKRHSYNLGKSMEKSSDFMLYSEMFFLFCVCCDEGWMGDKDGTVRTEARMTATATMTATSLRLNQKPHFQNMRLTSTAQINARFASGPPGIVFGLCEKLDRMCPVAITPNPP